LKHRFELRVYYEDTDFAGVVYYANYLKFIERARTEFMRSLGIDQTRFRVETGLVFAVRSLEAEYLKPAKFDDELAVVTSLESLSGARAVLKQDVFRNNDRLFSSRVTIACIADSGRPCRFPEIAAAALRRHARGNR